MMVPKLPLYASLRGAISVCLEALREIFDESAYARFLHRQGTRSCPTAYAAFLREQSVARSHRPRCC